MLLSLSQIFGNTYSLLTPIYLNFHPTLMFWSPPVQVTDRVQPLTKTNHKGDFGHLHFVTVNLSFEINNKMNYNNGWFHVHSFMSISVARCTFKQRPLLINKSWVRTSLRLFNCLYLQRFFLKNCRFFSWDFYDRN